MFDTDILSCALQPGIYEDRVATWRQLWSLAAKLISLPSTSRAACLLLHTIIEADFLPYHAISEEINSIVTTADVNGPGVLCDTSLALMSHLFHIRNARLPGASHSTGNHIIRWVFLRWNPSTFLNSDYVLKLTSKNRRAELCVIPSRSRQTS